MICRSNMIPFGNGDYHKGLFIDGRLSVDFERELDKVTFGKCEIFPCDADLPCPYEDITANAMMSLLRMSGGRQTIPRPSAQRSGLHSSMMPRFSSPAVSKS